MATNKYELVMDDTIEVKGRTLYRIRALKALPFQPLFSREGVKVGHLGGYIESEDNLSQFGDCWVDNEAMVYENAQVYGDAVVCIRAEVYGEAYVYGKSRINNFAQVCGNAKVYGKADITMGGVVYGNARVYGDATVYNARVYDKAEVFGKAYVADKARVFGKAKVYEDARARGCVLGGDVEVCGDVVISEGVELSSGKYDSGDISVTPRKQKISTKKLENDLMSRMDGEDEWNDSEFKTKRK
jgi:predicted acyltransferase (DUF342 family)